MRFALALAAAVAAVTPPPVTAEAFKLPGGALVVTSVDRGSAWAVIDTFFGVGSSSDFQGYQGLAAATAQALWNTGSLAPAPRIAAWGGTSWVGVERTSMHFQARVPARRRTEALEAIGEAFSHPDFASMKLDAVRQAYDAFAARSLETPVQRATQWFYAASFDRDMGHPVYGHGFPEIGRNELEAFNQRCLLPNRLEVVLTGDVDSGKAVGEVVRGFAAVLQRTPPGGAIPMRMEQPGPPIAAPAPNTLLVLAARGPELKNERSQAAMEILTKVLAGSEGARLDRALAPLGNARVTDARWLRAGVVVVHVAGDREALPAVRKAVDDTLADLRTTPISLDEHARALRAALDEEIPLLHDPATRATALGLAALAIGDPRWLRTYPEELRQVSRQDVMEAAQKYLTGDGLKLLGATP